MSHKEATSPDLVKASEARLALVASQIKGKILFPKKVEEAKGIPDHARFVKKVNKKFSIK